MMMVCPRKVKLYKKLHLTCLLIRLLSAEEKWLRYHAVIALGEIGNRRALASIKIMLEEDKPGWWIDDVQQTLIDLKPHYRWDDDILDDIHRFSKRWDVTLQKEAETAIAQIESRYSNHE